jgi:hypothetical protein
MFLPTQVLIVLAFSRRHRETHNKYMRSTYHLHFFSRTIHFEVLNSMDTNSFVKPLRRFISYRGCPKIIKDPNIVAGENKLALGIGNLKSAPTVGEMAAVTVLAAGPL